MWHAKSSEIADIVSVGVFAYKESKNLSLQSEMTYLSWSISLVYRTRPRDSASSRSSNTYEPSKPIENFPSQFGVALHRVADVAERAHDCKRWVSTISVFLIVPSLSYNVLFLTARKSCITIVSEPPFSKFDQRRWRALTTLFLCIYLNSAVFGTLMAGHSMCGGYTPKATYFQTKSTGVASELILAAIVWVSQTMEFLISLH